MRLRLYNEASRVTDASVRLMILESSQEQQLQVMHAYSHALAKSLPFGLNLTLDTAFSCCVTVALGA